MLVFGRRGIGMVLACAGLLVMLSATIARTQTFRGSVLGTVTDTTGAAVSGANVTIHNVETGIDRMTNTAVDGSYLIPELPIGNYNVTVELNGFQKTVTNGV